MEYFVEKDLGSFRKLATTLCFTVIVTIVIFYLKYAIKRKKYSSIFPTKQMRFTSLYGHVSDFMSISRFKEISLNAYVMQAFLGHHVLFKNEKLFTFWFAFSPVFMMSKAETVEAVISGSKNIQKNWMYRWIHPWLGTGILTSHGNKWKSRRKLLTPSFHFDILKDFLPVINEQSQILVKALEKEIEKPWIDITQPVILCSLDIICETTLGVSVGAQINSESEYVQAVGRISDAIMKRMTYPPHYLDWYFNITPAGIQHKKDLKLLHGFTRKAISEKKMKLLCGDTVHNTRKRKALMDLLLEEHIQNKTLTEDDVREEVDTFTFAGHDTTAMGISWVLYLIGLYKDVQEKLQEELYSVFGDDDERPVTLEDLKDMVYLERVLKESLRLYPSVPFFFRRLTDEVVIDGNKLPKDVTVCVSPFCLHRDETQFPNAEVFDPDRFLPENSAKRHPFAYIPFSAGPRNCIGQRFAMLEEKVIVANILRNFSLTSLDDRDKVIPVPDLILKPSGPLRIKLTPR